MIIIALNICRYNALWGEYGNYCNFFSDKMYLYRQLTDYDMC